MPFVDWQNIWIEVLFGEKRETVRHFEKQCPAVL
jgi:hypothetical protein